MVIASSGWMQNASNSNDEKIMSATGILICHDNSYPFLERTLSLEQPIKIGRSVARARAANDNAIFDCKVLSRNHALLWYDSGKFYLKDTKSSNGTFINNKRLSPSGEESTAYEVCSGDVVQFGVDVVESTKKVTHGCIIATLKLYLPDGKEAKTTLSNSIACINVTLEDLYKLNQFIQEAAQREHALRSKLEYMQQLLEHTRLSAHQSWKALVLEDCLLSRLEMLESQVVAYSKNLGEDKLRNELANLLEDRVQYQSATKELLQKKVQERREIINKIQILKCRLSETEEETKSLNNIIKDNQNELQELAIKYIKVQQTLQETNDKLNKTKIKLKEVIEQSESEKQEFLKKIEYQKSIERNLQSSLHDSKLDTVHIHKQISALRNYMQTLQDIKSATDEPHDFQNLANVIDAINIILTKWNSLKLDIVDNDAVFHDEQPDNEIQPIDNIKSQKLLTDGIFKIDHTINSTILENKQMKYILPPITSKALMMTNSMQDSKKLETEFENECIIENTEDSVNCLSDLVDVKKIDDISIVQIDNISIEEKESIASVKLIMRFSKNKCDKNIDQKMSKNNNLDVSHVVLDKFEYENSFSQSLSAQIIKVAQQINKIIKINNQMLNSKHSDSNIDDLCLQKDSSIKTLKSSNNIDYSVNKHSQELILQNLIRTSNFFRNNSGFKNNNMIAQEVQELKNWLLQESNDIIVDKLNEYYLQIENETQQIQELSEQLVMLKEKYNLTIDEKSKLHKKYENLESQYKDFINTSYMVPIYYVAPIMFALLWMILEKIL